MLHEISEMPLLVRRYGEQIARAYKIVHSNITIMREEPKQKDELLNARKKRKKGKRIAVERKFVFITKEILQLIKKIETKTTTKKIYKQPRKRPIQKILEDEEDEVLKNEASNSDSDCIVLMPRK